MRFDLGSVSLDVDVKRTKEYYQTAPGLLCSCPGCRNFDRAAEHLPARVSAFFHSLGIDPRKPAEVYVNYTEDNGMLRYGGFYHLCGAMLRGEGGRDSIESAPGGHTSVWNRETSCRITEHFHAAFSQAIALLEENFPEPVLQMEIDASLPWLLTEENRYP